MPVVKKPKSITRKKVVRRKVTAKKAPVKKKVVRKKRAKTGGRAPGTPNKDSKKLSLLEYARKQRGKSPVEFLLDVMNAKTKTIRGHEVTYSDRIDAAKAAAPYCHPKLRSTEIKGEIIPATFIIEGA